MKQRTAPPQPLNTLDDEPVRRAPVTERSTQHAVKSAQPKPEQAGALQRIPLSLLVDSPYQPRLSYDPERIDELGKGLQNAGQQEPILVRPLPSGQYELVSGHRRKRAAMNIGWTEITALIEHLSDQDAEKRTLVQNVGRVDHCEYELAKIYRTALERKLVKNQSECAEMFSTSQATVSKILAILDLPAPIVAMLEKTPTLFGAATAAVIKDLFKSYPGRESLIIQAVERLKDGASGASLRGWVAQMIAHEKNDAAPLPRSVVTNSEGSPVLEMRSKPERRQIVISLKDTGINQADFEKWLLVELRKTQEQA